MSVSGALRRAVAVLDEHVVARYGVRREGPSLITLLFHGLFEGDAEIATETVHPQEAVTVASFRRILNCFGAAGYRFVSLADIVGGLEHPGRYACITFDDGYANNLRALTPLEEYCAPAAIFVTTGNVRTGRRFWWDVVHHERHKRGASATSISSEIRFLESQTPDSIARYLTDAFGESALDPRGDLDRPLTRAELQRLAAHDLVTIGNHTVDHVMLTRVGSDTANRQLVDAQDYLETCTGVRPLAVAYPEGAYSAAVLDIARDVGFSCCFTTIPRKERIPVSAERLIALGRFQLDGRRDIESQIRVVRSELQLANALRRARTRAPA